MATWSRELELAPRVVNEPGFTFSSPALARRGDLWSNPSAGQFGKLTIKYVTKLTDSDHEAIWYIVAFEDPTNLITALHIGEGMGMGTFEVPIKVNV
jgi:FPC/CPF motif-containing protein YcgG